MAEGYCKVPWRNISIPADRTIDVLLSCKAKVGRVDVWTLVTDAVASPWAPTAALPSKALISASGRYPARYFLSNYRSSDRIAPPLNNAAASFPI